MVRERESRVREEWGERVMSEGERESGVRESGVRKSGVRERVGLETGVRERDCGARESVG